MTFKFGKHDCTKDYCNLCKEMVSFDHECFIKVVPKDRDISSPILADTMKLHGNSAYGKSVTNQEMQAS